MAVKVADTLKQQNGLDFPLVDGNDTKGGVHCVNNIAERDAILTSQKKKPGMFVYVLDNGNGESKTYQLNSDGTAFEEFNGILDDETLTVIKEYIVDNVETSTYTEIDENSGYLDLL